MSLNRYIAISIDPSTEVGALCVASTLRKAGWRTELFLTAGYEADRFERTILKDPSIHAVIDFSFHDLLSTRLLVSPPGSPERLTSAPLLGLPLVIVPGSLDHVRVHEVRDELLPRKSMKQDETIMLYRTSLQDNDTMGKELAFKASASKGPVTIVFPRGGLSQWDREGELLHDHDANLALLDSLHLWKAPDVTLIESHRHINDPLFAQIVVEHLLKLLVVRK